MDVTEQLTRNVVKLRTDADLKQKVVAEAIGMNATSYNHMEGGRQGMKLEQLIKLRDFYIKRGIAVTLDFIVTGQNPPVIAPELEKMSSQIKHLKSELTKTKAELAQVKEDNSSLIKSVAKLSK